ncbi:TIGR02594 family protein [Caulobacter sp. RHG1]|uniref:TIGR02594 family protein n=1 Tax=Caulobacter sp. (strain RHG1) TaxID=2545762 RepID=UPI001556DBBD|nr:TIGR02594 family protein [Caulobacter sp. RHG1]NQE60948.1 hypothetical protein [Caulobacter sp. RHG1]
MPTLAKEYQWLKQLDLLPKMVTSALESYGVKETQGPGNTPEIMAWATQTGLRSSYNADAIPWCGLFMAYVAKSSGKAFPKDPLWALNWSKFGEDGGQPELGDVLVFVRKGGGHVGLYIGEDSECYHVLGGNQGDAVSITRIDKERLYAVRQPPYNNKPSTAKTYLLSSNGKKSVDEA